MRRRDAAGDSEAGPIPSLRPYQEEGVAFLARRDAALLADEMGLGKTVQVAVAVDLCLREPGCDRVLVITPASLRLNWERELQAWAPRLAVRRVQGSAEDRAAYYRLPIPVLIASYDQVRADMPSIAPHVRFDLVVLDEAQRIKNRHSATALACSLITRSRSWALTGTPIQNSPEDLVSIFHFVRPGLLHDGLPRASLHERMQFHFLRRRKADVLPELPPILTQEVPLELGGRQQAAYDELWESRSRLLRAGGVPVSQTSFLALITKLKQVCNHDRDSGESVKLDYLRLVMEAAAEPDDKVVVFSQYVETLMWISARMADVDHAVFHGGLLERERDAIVQTFEGEPGPRLLLMSLQAGGVGINLASASTVVLFDRWWNPAVEEQAIHRAHRFGRQRPLHVIRLQVTNSIEQRIETVIAEKARIVDAFTDAAPSAAVVPFSRDELRRLLDLPTAEVDE